LSDAFVDISVVCLSWTVVWGGRIESRRGSRAFIFTSTTFCSVVMTVLQQCLCHCSLLLFVGWWNECQCQFTYWV